MTNRKDLFSWTSQICLIFWEQSKTYADEQMSCKEYGAPKSGIHHGPLKHVAGDWNVMQGFRYQN